MDSPNASIPTAEMASQDSQTDLASCRRTIAFYMMLIGFIISAVMETGLNVWVRRRNRIRRPNQVFRGHNIEAAYSKSPNHIQTTGSRTLNAFRAATGEISNVIRAKRMKTPASGNNPEEIELPRSARVYHSPFIRPEGQVWHQKRQE